MQTYKTVEKSAEAEFTERKSRFIGWAAPATTEQEAVAFVAARKSLHNQATHNCWAYIIKENNAQRYSDDGEPKGTAGIPILEILRKEEIFNAVVVVTRYYGGIQLGAGGLIRAYSTGAKTALEASGKITMAPCQIISLELPYPVYDRFLAATKSYPMKILDSDYAADITLTLRLREDYCPQLEEVITELTAGAVKVNATSKEFAPI